MKGIEASEKGLEIFKFSINLDIDKLFNAEMNLSLVNDVLYVWEQ